MKSISILNVSPWHDVKIEKRGMHNPLRQDEIDKMLMLWAIGSTISEIAYATKRSRPCVQSIVNPKEGSKDMPMQYFDVDKYTKNLITI